MMCAVATPKQIRELMKVDGLTNDEVKSHLQVSHLIISDDHHALLTLTSASVLTKTFDDGSEVSTAHEAAERDGDGPEHRLQRQLRRGAARAAVHRGGRHLGAAAGVRGGGTASRRRRVRNDDDDDRRHGVRSGGDAAVRSAAGAAGPTQGRSQDGDFFIVRRA